MKKLTFIMLIVVLIYGNCKSAKETPSPSKKYTLPDLTLAGKRIFTCFINDTTWLNTGNHVMQGSWGNGLAPNLETSVSYSKSIDSTKITIEGNMFTTTRNDYLSLNFSCKGIPKIAEIYTFNTKPVVNFEIKYTPNVYPGVNTGYENYPLFITDPELSNSANISFVKVDTLKRIISAVFYAKIFTSQNKILQKGTKTITQGRFDINY
jgi:hypothetical protein